MSVVPSGSPPDTRNTTLNMLNVQIAPSRTAGKRFGATIGIVTRQSRCQRVAPSTSAASSTSFGTAVSAASVTTIMNGKPSHTLVAKLAEKALKKRPHHENGSTPTASRSALTAPNCLLNIPRHASAVTYDGTAHGTIKST